MMMTAIRAFLWAAAAFIVLSMLHASAQKDDTDPPDSRSGMRLMIDARTGCHYLGNARSGITPRLTVTGKHICDGATP